jgi:hypothetical protein
MIYGNILLGTVHFPSYIMHILRFEINYVIHVQVTGAVIKTNDLKAL